jgi:S1-C subfamily serine protease
MNLYTGTGFYISEDGKIVTNLHIVRPWLFDKELSLISDQYKMFMASAASENPALNAFTAQIKVEGVLAYIGMIPNGAYFSDENLKQCRELIAHDNTDKDVAILQLETKKLPDSNCSIIDINQAIINDSEIQVGSHIYTMGFPFGLTLQDLKSPNGIQLLGHGGSITQECTKYSFGFDAASYGGASGSPIFNDKGQLIGVLNSGISKSQGFNYAIKASHVIDLLNNNISQSNN